MLHINLQDAGVSHELTIDIYLPRSEAECFTKLMLGLLIVSLIVNSVKKMPEYARRAAFGSAEPNMEVSS